jgi:hypothetical protein
MQHDCTLEVSSVQSYQGVIDEWGTIASLGRKT